MSVPVIAEPVFQIGAFPVTNALVNSTVLMLAVSAFAFWFGKSIRKVPGKVQALVETLVETLFTYFDQVTRSRTKTMRFLPLVGSLFLFILL